MAAISAVGWAETASLSKPNNAESAWATLGFAALKPT